MVDEGMNSSYKFLQKLWILNQKIVDEINSAHPTSSKKDLDIITAQFIENVEKNIEKFSYNKIIANFHEVYSEVNKLLNLKFDKESWVRNYRNILIVMSPVIPHFANECIEYLNIITKKDTVFWPNIDKNILINENTNYVIQINGKTRLVIELKNDIDEKELLQKINKIEKLKKYLNEKEIKKTIFIKKKLLNIIV